MFFGLKRSPRCRFPAISISLAMGWVPIPYTMEAGPCSLSYCLLEFCPSNPAGPDKSIRRHRRLYASPPLYSSLIPPPPLFNVGTLLRPLPTRILLNPTLSGGRGGGGAAGGYFCPALHRGSQKWRIRSLVYRPLIRSVLCGFSCMER